MRRNSTKPPRAARAFTRYRKSAEPSGDYLSQNCGPIHPGRQAAEIKLAAMRAVSTGRLHSLQFAAAPDCSNDQDGDCAEPRGEEVHQVAVEAQMRHAEDRRGRVDAEDHLTVQDTVQ